MPNGGGDQSAEVAGPAGAGSGGSSSAAASGTANGVGGAMRGDSSIAGGGSPPSGGGEGQASGAGGTLGQAGSGGTGSKLNVCPEGPFPAPMVLSSKAICENFTFDYSWNEGPTWIESQHAFFFSNFATGTTGDGNIIKYVPGGDCELFMSDVGCNGLAASNDGMLLAACHQSRSVVRIDLATKQTTTIADRYMDMMFDAPNDLVQHSNGSIYFTNPPYELGGRPAGFGSAAFRIDPEGKTSLIGTGSCNGIALSPDEKRLYVLRLGMWDLDAQGAPSNEQPLFTGGDGVAVDCAGNLYAEGSIFSPDGETVGSWDGGTNLAFGGEERTTVLVTGIGRRLRELTVNLPGLP